MSKHGEESGPTPAEVEASDILLRMFHTLPPESAIRALCSAHLRPLTEALERAERYGYKQGYEQCRRDHLNGMVADYILHPGAPTREELDEIRQERQIPGVGRDQWPRYEPVERGDDYQGGRWQQGKGQ